MSNLNRLQLMDLAGNQLEGSLPSFWASSPKLEYFSVQNNFLTGSVPTTRIPFKLRGDHGFGDAEPDIRNKFSKAAAPCDVTLLCLYVE